MTAGDIRFVSKSEQPLPEIFLFRLNQFSAYRYGSLFSGGKGLRPLCGEKQRVEELRLCYHVGMCGSVAVGGIAVYRYLYSMASVRQLSGRCYAGVRIHGIARLYGSA